MSRCFPYNCISVFLFVTQNQDEQPKFHEMSLSLTIPDATSCRLKMHLTFDNRCPYFANSFLVLFLAIFRSSRLVRVASVVVGDGFDDRYRETFETEKSFVFVAHALQHVVSFQPPFAGVFVSW
jgi:hypothetical protein